MTRAFSSEGLTRKRLVPYQQKDGYHKDGSPRLPKWKVRTTNGVMSANEYYWWYYFGDHPKGLVPIWLDRSAPLDTRKSNLILLSYRELKNLVYHNNRMYVIGNKKLQRLAIGVARTSIALADGRRSLNEKREGSNSNYSC